jgi:hydroxymethylbilane synthase
MRSRACSRQRNRHDNGSARARFSPGDLAAANHAKAERACAEQQRRSGLGCRDLCAAGQREVAKIEVFRQAAVGGAIPVFQLHITAIADVKPGFTGLLHTGKSELSASHLHSNPSRRPPECYTTSMNTALPIRAGTRGSPLALVQTRTFLRLIAAVPGAGEGQELIINTTGDAVQDRPLADIGGKGLFAKEIHEALLDRRIDCAVHSLKDLETELPPNIVIGCMLAREDARDVLILGDTCGTPDLGDPLTALPHAALVGTSSVRRQAQLLHARPDLRVASIRGNVQTRLRKLREGECQASLLALAGLRRLEMDVPGVAVLDPSVMLPAAAQGVVGITVRADDTALRALLATIEDRAARIAATAERALLATLDGSCRTPIGAHAFLLADGSLTLTGLVARADGSFLLRRTLTGPSADAARIGEELGNSLRADSPADLFA